MAHSTSVRVASPFAEVDFPTEMVYEQGGVAQRILVSNGRRSKSSTLIPGRFFITQCNRAKFIEWKAELVNDEGQVADVPFRGFGEGVGFKTTLNDSGMVTFEDPASDEQRTSKNFKIDLEDIRSLSISHPKGAPEELNIHLVDGSLLNPLVFTRGGPINVIAALRRFVTLEQQRNKSSYILKSRRENFHQSPPSITDLLPEPAKQALGYVNDFTTDPRGTSINMLSKAGGFAVNALQNYLDNHLHPNATSPCSSPTQNTAGNASGNLAPRDSDADYTTNDDGYEVVFKPMSVIALKPKRHTYRGQPLSQEQWLSYLTNDGKVSHFDEIKRIVFQGGVHPDIKKIVWPFLLGLYSPDSTFEEREALFEEKIKDYNRMKTQWQSISPDQEERFHTFRDSKSLVDKDVTRTDRSLDFYKGDTSEGLETLRSILMTYVMYNFNLGYVQGMSDILAPILMEVQDEVMAFWLFVQYMDRINSNFEMSQEGMKAQLTNMYEILRVVDPKFSAYLDACDASNMFFAFRWMLILFKREFSTDDVLTLWEVLWTELPGPNFPLVFGVAILELHRNTIIDNKYGLSEILRHLNDLSLRIDLEDSLKLAEAVYLQLLDSQEELPATVRKVLGLPSQEDSVCSASSGSLVGAASSSEGGTSTSTSVTCSQELTCAEIRLDEQLERQYEDSLRHQFL